MDLEHEKEQQRNMQSRDNRKNRNADYFFM
jgi:hypothetical protein